MAENFIRDGSGKVIGTTGGGDANSSSGSSSGGDDSKLLRVGVDSEVTSAINNMFEAGLMNSFNPIRGLPQAFQGFAIEATMRGMGLQGITSSLSLPSPGKLNGRKR